MGGNPLATLAAAAEGDAVTADVWAYAHEKRERLFQRHPDAMLGHCPVHSFFPDQMVQGDLYDAYWPRRPMTAEDLGLAI